MAEEESPAGNPFSEVAKKAIEHRDALEFERNQERLRFLEEYKQQLESAKQRLIEDTKCAIAEIPPLQLNDVGSIKFETEAFAWFAKHAALSTRDLSHRFKESYILVAAHSNGELVWYNSDDSHFTRARGENGIRQCAYLPSRNIITSSWSGFQIWSNGTSNSIELDEGMELTGGRFSTSRNGRYLAFYIEGKNRLCIYDMSTETYQTVRIRRPYLYASNMSFSPDGMLLCAGQSRRGTLVFVDPSTGTVRKQLKTGSRRIASFAFSPNGKTAVSIEWNGLLKLWDLQNNDCIFSIEVEGDDGYIRPTEMKFSPDGDLLFVGMDYAKDTQVLDLKSRTWRPDLSQIIKNYPFDLSSDGKVLGLMENETCSLYDLKSWSLIRTWSDHSHPSRVVSISFRDRHLFDDIDLQIVYEDVCLLLAEVGFRLDSLDGVQFSIGWDAKP